MNHKKWSQLRSSHLQWSIYLLILVALLAAGCSGGKAKPTESSVEQPNPAASYCTALGYDIENGDCVFPDGAKCDAWDFYRGTCAQEKTYCEQQGFKIENRVEKAGSATYEYAVCGFDDGSECLEEAYQAGKCNPSECTKWLISKDGCVTN